LSMARQLQGCFSAKQEFKKWGGREEAALQLRHATAVPADARRGGAPPPGRR